MEEFESYQFISRHQEFHTGDLAVVVVTTFGQFLHLTTRFWDFITVCKHKITSLSLHSSLNFRWPYPTKRNPPFWTQACESRGIYYFPWVTTQILSLLYNLICANRHSLHPYICKRKIDVYLVSFIMNTYKI